MEVNALRKGHMFLILTKVQCVLAATWPEAEFRFSFLLPFIGVKLWLPT